MAGSLFGEASQSMVVPGGRLGKLGKGAGLVGKTGSRTLAAVSNMGEFFTSYEFGKLLAKASQKTGKQFQGQKIYQVTKKIELGAGSMLKKGDQFYLDGLHMDHIEVFNRQGGKARVFDFSGNLMAKKTRDAKNRRLF